MRTKRKKYTKSGTKGYEEFLRNLKIFGLGLESSASQLDRSAYARLHEQKKNRVRNIAATYELVRVEREVFDATAKFKLTVEDKKTKMQPLKIECVFQTHFHGKKPVDKQFAERFTRSELRLVVWPYFRQFVSDMTAKMAIPPIIVPLSTES